MQRRYAMMVSVLALAACAGPSAPPSPPSAVDVAVARRPLEAPPAPPATRAPAANVPGAIDVPATALYVCAVEAAGEWRQTAIEFAPKIDALCRRHPEMGPCQYEREACRRKGGRVFAAGGQEITRQVEAEYDRKVMRVRLRAN